MQVLTNRDVKPSEGSYVLFLAFCLKGKIRYKLFKTSTSLLHQDICTRVENKKQETYAAHSLHRREMLEKRMLP